MNDFEKKALSDDDVFVGYMAYDLNKNKGKTLPYRVDDLSRLFNIAGEPVPPAIGGHLSTTIDYPVDEVAALIGRIDKKFGP